MTRVQRFARWSAATAMAWAIVSGQPLAAQGGATPPPPAPAQTPAPQGPTLRLSMNDAVTMAMETSLGLQATRMNLDVAAQNIIGARASFLPQISSSFNNSTRKATPSDFTQGTVDITSRNISFQGRSQQLLPWFGSGYSVSWNGNRSSSVGGFPTFAPGLGSSISVNFTQPLWRGFLIDGTRAAIQTSERQRVITDIQVQQQVVAVDAGVRNAYLQLLSALENLKVADQNRSLAEESLRGARARVNVGQAPPIDVVQAEAQVAGMEDAVITAQAAILTAEDVLRSLILDPNRPDYWQLHIEPTDSIPDEVADRPVDVDAAIRNALQNRLDLQADRRALEISDLNIRVARNATKPSVDLSVGYSASGTGGTRIQYGEGFPPVEVDRSTKSFGSTVAETFSGAYPSWNLGVSVQYPIGRTATEASLARAQIARRQQDLQLRQLELDVVREVRQAARDVDTAKQRVRATQRALDLAQQQLDAENRKFEVGISTPFERQSRESQLAQARVNHAAARIAYSRALIRFDTVQKTR